MKKPVFYSEKNQNLAAANHAGGNTAPVMIQREPGKVTPSTDANDEKLKAAALKVGEAFLMTDDAKKLIDDNQMVKWGKKTGEEFINTWYGKVISGLAATAYLGGFAAANTKLPFQLPALPLDFIRPGLSLQIKSDGPVNNKPAFSFTLTFREQVKKIPAQSATEKYRADTEKMRHENVKWQERFKTPEQRKQDELMDRYLHDQLMERASKLLNLPEKEAESQH